VAVELLKGTRFLPAVMHTGIFQLVGSAGVEAISDFIRRVAGVGNSKREN